MFNKFYIEDNYIIDFDYLEFKINELVKNYNKYNNLNIFICHNCLKININGKNYFVTIIKNKENKYWYIRTQNNKYYKYSIKYKFDTILKKIKTIIK